MERRAWHVALVVVGVALLWQGCGRPTPAAPVASEPSQAAPAPVTIEQARLIYARSCASCHGPRGRGDGHRAGRLRQRPTDFTARSWQEGVDDATIKAQIQRGSGPMPAFRIKLTEAEIDRLVEVVRGFGPGAGADEQGP